MDPNIAKALEAINDMANDPEIRETVRLRELANMNWRHSHARALEEGLEKGGRKMLLAKIEQLATAFSVPGDPSRLEGLAGMTNEQLESVFAFLLAHRRWPDE